MPDSAELYEQTRSMLSELVRGLTEEELQKKVPATPGWSIRDIISHLSGDAASVQAGDFPEEFFASFGDDAAVVLLNGWTTKHIERRKDMSLEEVLAEWEEGSVAVTSMMRGETPWPGSIPPFADRVLLTDIGAHQQDIYGALGIERDREGPLVRMGTAGYVTVMGFRLPSAGLSPLRVEAGDSVRSSGEGEPGATVRASRFEMFRALSGRRSPDQIKAYDWDGDPEPYIDYFYPYGKREEALVE